ncbi:MAG: MOSC domain-containing protein [Planctomycetota bacterium]|nr:MOSC domain-containing protein [Planctomycetota bacterium]
MSEKTGTLVGIYISENRCRPLRRVHEIEAVAGRGLSGDRYFLKDGCFSNYPGRGRHVTLIEKEVLEELGPEQRVSVEEARRNLLTENVDLNSLVGAYFKIGAVVLRGDRLCHPCEHLEALTNRPVLKALKGKGGLRADVIIGGRLYSDLPLTRLPKEWVPEESPN